MPEVHPFYETHRSAMEAAMRQRLDLAEAMLCERAQLWGKAQTYFEASLAIENRWRTRVALGELFARLNRDFDANAQLAAALKLALAELDRG